MGTGFIANDKVWKIFFQDSRLAFDKINSPSKAMVDSSVVKIDAAMVMRENLAQYESIVKNRFKGESRECRTRLTNVLRKTPGVVSKGWGSWCRVIQAAPSIHDVYLARNIKRNLMDFKVIRECITARAKVVRDLYAARNRALKWKNTELRSKDLSQKHADDLRLEELEMLSRILYKLVTKQFLYVWQATQHKFSGSMGRFMSMQGRKYTQIKELWQASITRLRREVPLQ